MSDRLPPKGMFSGSRDVFKFWELVILSWKWCTIETWL